MKTRAILIIAGITLILIAVVTGMLLKHDVEPVTEIQTEKRYAEPEFRPEGELYFIRDISADTLSILTIEIVDQPGEIEQGMMFRSQLESGHGMFFIFDREEEQVFWMKNTGISLDIIFADDDLRIVHIARHTLPYSEEPIMSMVPSRYVIEARAGYCDKHGIQQSDLVRYDVFESGNGP